VTFISADDLELYNKWESKAFELQVANHELLGHGSGKLFTEDAKGNLNFDKERVSYFMNDQRVLFSYRTA
jgi:dipeptidyl-peptidase III